MNFSVTEYLDINIRLCEQCNITSIKSSFLVRKLIGINSPIFSEILLWKIYSTRANMPLITVFFLMKVAEKLHSHIPSVRGNLVE